jgi:hypothetical protein
MLLAFLGLPRAPSLHVSEESLEATVQNGAIAGGDHCARSATIGFTRDARRAGT